MLVTADAVAWDKARIAYEKKRARQARYENTAKARERKRRYNNSERGRELDSQRQRGRRDGKIPYSQYPFVMWDGEAPQDTGYSLFGSSLGHEICHPRLSTEECFDLLLQARQEYPESIHVIFGGRYDFDEICRQSMPYDRLSRLKTTGHVFWHGYTIQQAEGKFFTLKKDGVSITVYEIFGWFHKAYARALEDYGIGPWKSSLTAQSAETRSGLSLRHALSVLIRSKQQDSLSQQDASTSELPLSEVIGGLGSLTEAEIVHCGKSARGEFLWEDIELIRRYMRLELKYGPVLMDKIREIVLAAGFNPRSWYGPSALALEALRKNKIQQYMGKVPEPVLRASQFAYAGGRFETFRGGVLEPVYTYDKNSAYMAAALQLPCLAHGEWRKAQKYEHGKFALYHIRYDSRMRAIENPVASATYPYPLFYRDKHGNVSWPNRVESWYWAPEAELVKDDPDAYFTEAWVFDQACTHKPFAFVSEWYRKRLLLESLPASNPSRRAGKAFKWALASVYGQLARAVGFDRFRKQSPKYHQLEWAGYITSQCRADMWNLAIQAGDKLISIDTDSVTAMCPLTVNEGDQLGQWKSMEAEHGVFFQSGVFALQRGSDWIETKSRGIEEDKFTRRVPVSPEMMISAMHDGRAIELKPRKRYVSVRMALNHRLSEMGEWKTHPADTISFGGNGKRYHRESTCKPRNGGVQFCRSSDEHVFVPRRQLPGSHEEFMLTDVPKSQPHLLPWRDDMTGQLDKNLIADILWVDPEQIDMDDEWIRQLI